MAHGIDCVTSGPYSKVLTPEKASSSSHAKINYRNHRNIVIGKICFLWIATEFVKSTESCVLPKALRLISILFGLI